MRPALVISSVSSICGGLLASLDVPQGTCGVSRTGNYLIVIQEPATGQITCVSRQLTTHTHIPFTSFQVVNGADVNQATTGHIIPRRSVCTGHDPRGAQRDGMNLVCGITVPDDEFSRSEESRVWKECRSLMSPYD